MTDSIYDEFFTAKDPVDEMIVVLTQTLAANGLYITSNVGGYVGGGQPHPTLRSDDRDIEAVARGLLARKVALADTGSADDD